MPRISDSAIPLLSAILLVIFYGFVALSLNALTALLYRVGWSPVARLNWQIRFVVATVLALTLAGLGWFNASYPQLVTYRLEVPKAATLPHDPTATSIKLLAISDVHWDTLYDKEIVSRVTKLITSRQPDLILLLGDYVTLDTQKFLDDKVASLLGSMTSSYGTYAVVGNHDTYDGHLEDLVAAFTANGITVLRDEVVLIADSLWLIGMNDYGGMRRRVVNFRKSLEELLTEVNQEQVVVVLDHQPRRLQEAAALGIDLHLAGHTHGGQVWPITYLAKGMYEHSIGLLTLENSSFIVTSGIGYWGPPFRLGTRCQIIEIIISFNR